MLVSPALPILIGLTGSILIAIVFGLVVVILLTATPAQAALPPQSNDELWEDSLFVVTGTVQEVSIEEISSDVGSDYQYHSVFTVETVEKSESALLTGSLLSDILPAPNKQINVFYWQVGKRPSGWTGRTGQYTTLRPNISVRLFLTLQDGKFTLLEPNGWEPLD